MPLAPPAPAPPACVAPLAAAVARRCSGGGAGEVTCWQPATAAAAATVRNDGSDGVMAAMAATAATVATVAVRRVGERRHGGNLADARAQPNDLTPPQNFAEGSAQRQCPVVLYERKGSRGQQDCGRAEKRSGQKQQEEGRTERESCGGGKRI